MTARRRGTGRGAARGAPGSGRRTGAGRGAPGSRRRAAAVAAWATFLAGCVAALHGLGGPLAPPPLSDPSGLGPWLDARLPAEAAVAVARLAALALAWYLLAATAAGVLAHVSGAASAVRLADAVSIPTVRRIVHGAVGLSLVAGTAGVSPAVAVADAIGGAASGPPPTMRVLPEAAAAVLPPGVPAPGIDRTRSIPGARSAEPAATADEAPGRPGAGDAGPVTWTVGPGDHLWGVAERTLAEAWGRPPGDAEVDPYWRAVIEANRDRLRDPANPDLVFAGQVLVLPPLP